MKQNPVLGLAFALPAILLIGIFLVYPTIQTVRFSFYDGVGLNLDQYEYVGLENYVNLFTRDNGFFNIDRFPPTGAVFNTILWLVLYPVFTVSLGLLIAVMANIVRYEVLVKTIIFVPMAISFTAAGIIWRFVYSPDERTGILNAVYTALSGQEPIPWLGRTDMVNFGIIIAAVWLSTGFCMVVLSAALKSLPGEVLEAARVDGANNWNTFWRIMVPMLWPTIVVVATTQIIGVLKAFDLVFIMTNGGPRGSSEIIGYTMYNETFQNGRAGYGMAVAVIMLIVVLPFVYLNIKRFRIERQ